MIPVDIWGIEITKDNEVLTCGEDAVNFPKDEGRMRRWAGWGKVNTTDQLWWEEMTGSGQSTYQNQGRT